MANLITRDDIAQYRQITDNVHTLKIINQHIIDAQFSDIQKLLGVDLYNDLIRNETDSKYVDLLNGGTYTYDNVTYTNVGLKAVIVHYAYGRYILQGSQTDTPFGYVQKTNNSSQEVSFAAKKNMSKMNQQMAFTYWENVKNFLDRNKTDYPLWNSNCNIRRGGFRISKIG